MNKLLIDDELFWHLVCYLEKISSEILLEDICSLLEIDKNKVLMGISYLQNLDYQLIVDFHHKKGAMVIPPPTKKTFELKLELTDWLALQAHFPLLYQYEDRPYFDNLMKKFSEIENIFPKGQLLNAEMPWPKVPEHKVEILKKQHQLKESLIKSIHEKYLISIEFLDQKKINVIPLHLEDNHENTFLLFETSHQTIEKEEIDNIKEVTFLTKNIKPYTTKKELDKFLRSLLNQQEKLFRAVLKISSHQKFNALNVPSSISKPYLTINGDGHLIWSGTTNLNQELLLWIDKFGKDIEIIAPVQLQDDFKQYQEDKLKFST